MERYATIETLVNSFIGKFKPANTVGIRLVGSQCKEYFASTPDTLACVDSESDIDLHIIVESLSGISENDRKRLGVYNTRRFGVMFDVLATKLRYEDILFSVHLFELGTFEAMCSFRKCDINICRQTKGKMNFLGFGSVKERQFSLSMIEEHGSTYHVLYTQKPLYDGSLFLFPYHSMILGGKKIEGDPLIDALSGRFSRSVARHFVEEEGVNDFSGFVRVFGPYIKNLSGSDIDRLKDLYEGARRSAVYEEIR